VVSLEQVSPTPIAEPTASSVEPTMSVNKTVSSVGHR